MFKIERDEGGAKIAYVRMRAGTLRTRDRVAHGKVTAIDVFEDGATVRRPAVAAGRIAKVRGLDGVRIGDSIGAADPGREHRFAPPTLETVVLARTPGDRRGLRVALEQLAEQDPLIDLRQDRLREEIAVSLYGEVQKEVIQATLADDFGVDVEFRESTTICIERPVGSGAAERHLGAGGNPFVATVGLRVDPAPRGAGVSFGLEVEPGALPASYFSAVEESVRETLGGGGLCGWRVTDCHVAMTHSGYAAKNGPRGAFVKSTTSTAGDFRGLTALVLRTALERAGTTVYEPLHRFHLELPADTLGAALPVLGRLGALPDPPELAGETCTIEGDIRAARVHELRRRLPALTRGEGVLESAFDRYEPARRPAPRR